MFIKKISELINKRPFRPFARFRLRINEHVRDLERKAGAILFLGAAAVATVAILILKGCGG